MTDTVKTYTTVGYTTFTVPNRVTEVIIKCWGAEGGSAQKSGGLGGYEKATLPVSGGDTLYIKVGKKGQKTSGGYPNGGDGGYDEEYDNPDNNIKAGGGGGSSEVRLNNNSQSDIVVIAGGGGGSGNAKGRDDETATGAGGDGGGNASDGGDASGFNGGIGGGASGYNGEDGFDGEYYGTFAASGGGGGGWNGGGTNDVLVDSNEKEGPGGGGGDGNVFSPASFNANSVGVNSGDGEVELRYVEPPQAPSNFTASVDNELNVTLSWNGDSNLEDKYEIYRSTTSGVDDTDTLVTTLSASTTSYIDSFSDDVDYYYRVRGVNDGVEGYFSNEVSIQASAINYYDGNQWVAKTAYHGQSLDVVKNIETY